jgi:hypothetical protein
MRRLLLFVVVVVAGSVSCAPPPMRFADRGILWDERDAQPIPMPRERVFYSDWVGLRDAVFLPVDRGLGLDYGDEAQNANALDEVGDSTWFRDPRRVLDADGRVWWRPLGGARVEAGPMDGLAHATPPFVVTKGKASGLNAGFQVRDANGQKWLLKFDHLGHIGLDTSTEAVTTRIVWSLGWNVPPVEIVDLAPDELRLSPAASMRDHVGDEVPLDARVLAAVLAQVPRLPDGRMRALASRWLEGRSVGPGPYFGRRDDDPNDRVPHEDRRDLRGLHAVYALINNTDALETNTLDMYVGRPGEGHVVHYQQDVGGAFGARATGPQSYWMGRTIYFDPLEAVASILTLGAWRRSWQGIDLKMARAAALARWPEIGFFDVEHFDPKGWTPVLDNPAFVRRTRRDRYWGAKRVALLTDDELEGAVRAGRYREAAARELVRVLKGRRERIVRAFFADAAPLESFAFRGRALCFEDWWVKLRLGGEAATRYQVTGAARGPVVDEGDGFTRCVALTDGSGYRVVSIAVARAGDRAPGRPVRVHFIDDGASGARRLIGIER